MTRPMRADAKRNREKLLAVAVTLLSGARESDAEVPLESIAKRAGVGIGTLYRHFPTRAALIEAAYRHEVQRLCAAAGELAARLPPDVALREWMDRFVSYVITKRGMAAALQSVVASDSTLYAQTYQQMVEALTTLLHAGAADGTIREDVEAADVLRALSGVWMVADSPDAREQAERLLNLLMDGLRYGAEVNSGKRPDRQPTVR
ncbi:MAG TPA: TetR/AcrR family transcriptional regulator [Pseudonocardia sp.]|nr:TetR/AcrR family transcriptional regulator [Pseudonocardia sp.]